jgi:serine/threonine-protein kinase
MELLQGESLQERLTRLGRLGHAELVQLSTGIRNALSSAHALDVVHRDIKPGNIFFAKRGRGEGTGEIVKLLDLGIAKDPSGGARLTATGTFLGTPHYMSPEQVTAGREVDAKADLWSTAVVLYQALTGVLPFLGSAAQATIKIATSSFAPPSLVLGLSRPAIDAFFEKAFSNQIRRRFATIDQLHEAFAAALGASSARTGSTLPGATSRFDATATAVGQAGYAELAVCVTRNDAAPREPAVEVVAPPLALDDMPLAAVLWQRTRDLVIAAGERPATCEARTVLLIACVYVVLTAFATAAACLLPSPGSRRAYRSRETRGSGRTALRSWTRA